VQLPRDAAGDVSAPLDVAAPPDADPTEAPPPDPVLETIMIRPGAERTLHHMDCTGNAAGDGMALWRETDPAGKHEVWAARLGRDGRWQPAESLGARPTTDLDRLGVTLDAGGQALAVWNELDGPQAGVVSARGMPGGWTEPGRIAPGWVLSLAGSAAGDAVAFGVVEGTAPTLLRYRPLTGWTMDVNLRLERAGFFFAGAGGRSVLLWNQPAGPGAHEFQASEYGDGTWSAPVRVQEAQPFDHPLPSVNATVAAGGNGLVVWNRGGELQGELWAAATSGPSQWEAPRRLSSGEAPLWTTTPVVQEGGRAMVSWETGMPPRRKVWAALRGEGGWQESVMLAEGAEADTAALAASGDALVAWSTARRVYGRHFTRAGGWGPARLALGDNGGVSDLCAFIDGQGRGWVLWVNGGPQKLRAAAIAP
jgi:hypothetical protein